MKNPLNRVLLFHLLRGLTKLDGKEFLVRNSLDYLSSTTSISTTDRKDLTKIEENKALERFKPVLRESISKNKGIQFNEKLQTVKEKRQNFMSIKREQKLQEFNDKMRRFEFRNNREKLSEVSKAWGVLMINWFYGITIYQKYGEVKDLKIRSEKLLVKFITRVRVIGKFEVVLKRSRVNFARKLLTKFVAPIKQMLYYRKAKRIKMITNIIENVASKELMFIAMARWQIKIIYCQRALKSCLPGIRLRNKKYRTEWTQAENELKNDMQRGKSVFKSVSSSTQRHMSKYIIPDYMKEYYIRKKLKEKVKQFMFKLKAYELECEELRNKYAEYDAMILISKNGMAIIPFPPKPIADYTFSINDYNNMIQEAFRNRTKFDAMYKFPTYRKRNVNKAL